MSYSIERVYLESIAIEIECNFDDIKWNWSNSLLDSLLSLSSPFALLLALSPLTSPRITSGLRYYRILNVILIS